MILLKSAIKEPRLDSIFMLPAYPHIFEILAFITTLLSPQKRILRIYTFPQRS